MDKINELISKKLFGLIQSIEKMSEKDKYQLPTHDFGEEVNKLFQMARDENPALKEFIPGDLEFSDYDIQGRKVSTPWHEIHSKLNQLYQLLN